MISSWPCWMRLDTWVWKRFGPQEWFSLIGNMMINTKELIWGTNVFV